MSLRIFPSGSILDDDADAIVCPVCCVPGVMGKGLALEFAKRWSNLKERHADLAGNRLLLPGTVLTAARGDGGYYETTILFAATKSHFMYPSKMPWIDKILDALVGWALCEQPRPKAIALPALGCGLGGLPWSGLGGVENVINDTFLNPATIRKLPDLEWRVYAPQG